LTLPWPHSGASDRPAKRCLSGRSSPVSSGGRLPSPTQRWRTQMSDVWPIVHAERQALADDLGNLSSDQWATPSLCDGWDVHDVLAHLVAAATMTRLKFVMLFARAGFNFDRFTANQVTAERGANPTSTLAAFRSAPPVLRRRRRRRSPASSRPSSTARTSGVRWGSCTSTRPRTSGRRSNTSRVTACRAVRRDSTVSR